MTNDIDTNNIKPSILLFALTMGVTGIILLVIGMYYYSNEYTNTDSFLLSLCLCIVSEFACGASLWWGHNS